MEFFNSILGLLATATNNPWAFLVVLVAGTLAVLGGGLWFKKFVQGLRDAKAKAEKDKDKERNIDDLENRHSDAATTVRDRIKNGTQP